MLKKILFIALVISVALNIALLVSGVKIMTSQYQSVENINMNANANLNINAEKTLSGKVVQETVLIDDVNGLTNFLKTLDSWSFINAKVLPLQKKGYLVYYPMAGASVKTNSLFSTNFATNTLKKGLR